MPPTVESSLPLQPHLAPPGASRNLSVQGPRQQTEGQRAPSQPQGDPRGLPEEGASWGRGRATANGPSRMGRGGTAKDNPCSGPDGKGGGGCGGRRPQATGFISESEWPPASFDPWPGLLDPAWDLPPRCYPLGKQRLAWPHTCPGVDTEGMRQACPRHCTNVPLASLDPPAHVPQCTSTGINGGDRQASGQGRLMAAMPLAGDRGRGCVTLPHPTPGRAESRKRCSLGPH